VRIPLRLILLAAVIAPVRAHAQSLDPRSFVDTPVGFNFVFAGFVYSWGSVLFDPTVPITNADLTQQGPFGGYARAIDFFGMSGKASIAAGYIFTDGTGDVRGVPESRTVSGLSDVTAAISVNFLGAPALRIPAYLKYKQGLLMGASLAITAPVGQYDPTKLVNIGTNRWTFRPQIGVSQALGHLTLEFLGAVAFYTTNTDFLNGRVHQQDPVFSAQFNSIYTFRSGIWGSLGATFYAGGRATTDGVEDPSFTENWRLGASLVFPVNHHNSLKVFGSTGLYTRTGGDFHVVAATWIYNWGGRPKHTPTTAPGAPTLIP
jgi:hypothetical protein